MVNNESSEQKLVQFNEFFAIKCTFSINVTAIENSQSLHYDDFMSRMPMPFKMATDIVTLDQAALRPLQTLGSVAGQLVDYLNHQAKKIDLLVSYILNQQDIEQYRYQGHSFGGGGVTFTSDIPFETAQKVELKIFLLEDNCAIYCCGEIIESKQQDNGFDHKVIFHHIREEDREILVRSSLHHQSKQLQALSRKRNTD
jgi:hypothetical protein